MPGREKNLILHKSEFNGFLREWRSKQLKRR
jgi:hypothetical protein